jgi:fibronectin type 3 domain-containing protein/RNase P/RNase MRP subunit p29
MINFVIKKAIILLVVLFAVIPLKAEYLFLKDGLIIKGKVVSETPNEVVIRDEKNKVITYPHNKVLRVLYTEISMGKVYVQMKSGENFKGYMIDEDRDSYTFRNDINKPEEFTVKRSKVLFIAERNPSELRGESGYTDISLTWSPPYDKMKFYNVYYKKDKDEKFILADASWSTSYKLKGLKSFTKYIIRVTGVDNSNAETTPSNEVEITTFAKVEVQLKDGKIFKTNLIADDYEKYTFRDDLAKPKDYTVKKANVIFITERYPTRLKGERGFSDITLSWDLPYDEMKYYNVYYKKNKDDKYIIADKTGSNSFKLKNLNSNTKYFIKVTGVDEKGIESAPSNEIELKTFTIVDVQLKDGKIYKTNLFEEDNEKYTFRDDLSKTKDYIVKRADIQYITDRYPTALKGKAGTDRINIEWFKPFDYMAGYKIYVKEEGKEYKTFSVPGNNTYTLKDLKSKTKYYIKITGVTKDKAETAQSNEIAVITFAKVEVQLKDGKSFKTNLIAEDNEKYTFRDDLSMIKDYTVKRADVVFITDRSPSGLKGESDATGITLSWSQPYDRMKYYNIYLKKDKDEKYKIVDTTGLNSFRLKNLNANTKYFIKVTGVDYNYIGNETPPTSELIITTKPADLKKDKNLLPSGLRFGYILTIPYTAPQYKVYSNLHGDDISYSYFFNDYISIKAGISFAFGTISIENANTVQSALNIGVNFGFPVIGFIYPYAGVAVKGLWLHEYARGIFFDFGGIGIDGNIGIAFSFSKNFGLYLEYSIGWTTVLDKAKTDISSMSVKTGVFFRL